MIRLEVYVAEFMNVWSMAVGQGQMNIVEHCDDNFGTITYKGVYLFDCGGSSKTLDMDLVKFILNRSPTQKFIGIFISHTDNDHANLLKAVAEYIDPSVSFSYGSHLQGTAGTKLGDYIRELAIAKPIQLKFGKKMAMIAQTGQLCIELLYTKNTGDPNDASAMFIVSIGTEKVIFTGDATATTFADFNTIYTTPLPPPCRLVMLPHHGSYTTASVGDPSMTQIGNFGDKIQAQHGVSTGYRGNWRHSNKAVFDAVVKARQAFPPHILFITDKTLAYIATSYSTSIFTNETASIVQSSATPSTSHTIDHKKVSYVHRIPFTGTNDVGYCVAGSYTISYDFTPLNMQLNQSSNKLQRSNQAQNRLDQPEIKNRKRYSAVAKTYT